MQYALRFSRSLEYLHAVDLRGGAGEGASCHYSLGGVHGERGQALADDEALPSQASTVPALRHEIALSPRTPTPQAPQTPTDADGKRTTDRNTRC